MKPGWQICSRWAWRVSGLEPKHAYVLALADNPEGGGKRETLASFTTSPAGPAIVNAIGQIRQVARDGGADTLRPAVSRSRTR